MSFFENILAPEIYSLSREELLGIKQKLTQRIVDMYFDGEFDEELREKIQSWLAGEDEFGMKEAAIRRKFDMMCEGRL